MSKIGRRIINSITLRIKERIIGQLCKTPIGRRIWILYVDLVWTRPTLRYVRREIIAMTQAADKDPDTRIRLVYNNSCSPPTYGNFVEVVMLARYLSLIGFAVDFVVICVEKGTLDWKHRGLSAHEADEFVEQQVALANYLLPETVNVHLLGDYEGQTNVGSTKASFTLFKGKVESAVNITAQCVYLLHELVEASGSSPPSGFLLERSQFSPPARAYSRLRPYVVWHVRRGIWDHERNPGEMILCEDFAELRRSFPNHTIMLLSTASGIEFTKEVLARRGYTLNWETGAPILEGQPDSGFIAAIPWLLGADFYYQRMGGGISTIALFSDIPYLMLLNDIAYWEGIARGDRMAPWAKDNQRTVVLPFDAGQVPLEWFLREA